MRTTLAYTSARILLLVVSIILLYLVGARGLLLLALACVVSGIASFVLLSRQRDVMSSALMNRIRNGQRRAGRVPGQARGRRPGRGRRLGRPVHPRWATPGSRRRPMPGVLHRLVAPHLYGAAIALGVLVAAGRAATRRLDARWFPRPGKAPWPDCVPGWPPPWSLRPCLLPPLRCYPTAPLRTWAAGQYRPLDSNRRAGDAGDRRPPGLCGGGQRLRGRIPRCAPAQPAGGAADSAPGRARAADRPDPAPLRPRR